MKRILFDQLHSKEAAWRSIARQCASHIFKMEVLVLFFYMYSVQYIAMYRTSIYSHHMGLFSFQNVKIFICNNEQWAENFLNVVWSVWDSYNYTVLDLLPGLVLNLCLSDPCDLELIIKVFTGSRKEKGQFHNQVIADIFNIPVLFSEQNHLIFKRIKDMSYFNINNLFSLHNLR